jgi:gamma-glutamylcyclotransferase (GGCT)/AIG2-like uncharacterized protein YtfP
MNTISPSIYVPRQEPVNDIRLFVYGTLKRGGRLHGWLQEFGAEFVNHTSIEGFTLFTFNGVFPVARPADEGRVNGEWWMVSERCFDAIASMEMNAGYDICTINGDTWFFAMMDDDLWQRINERYGCDVMALGSTWIVGKDKRFSRERV